MLLCRYYLCCCFYFVPVNIFILYFILKNSFLVSKKEKSASCCWAKVNKVHGRGNKRPPRPLCRTSQSITILGSPFQSGIIGSHCASVVVSLEHRHGGWKADGGGASLLCRRRSCTNLIIVVSAKINRGKRRY